MKLKGFNYEGLASIVFNQNIKQLLKENGKRALTTIESEQLVKRIFSFEITRDGVVMS